MKQALAEQLRFSEEAKARAVASQQQSQQAHQRTEQVSKALEAKDTTLASIKVVWHVPCFASPATPNITAYYMAGLHVEILHVTTHAIYYLVNRVEYMV